MIPLIGKVQKRQSTQTEGRPARPGARGRGDTKQPLTGEGFRFLGGENGLQPDRGADGTALDVLNALCCTFSNG